MAVDQVEAFVIAAYAPELIEPDQYLYSFAVFKQDSIFPSTLPWMCRINYQILQLSAFFS